MWSTYLALAWKPRSEKGDLSSSPTAVLKGSMGLSRAKG